MNAKFNKTETNRILLQQIEFAKILGQQTDFHEILRFVTHKSAQFLEADLALILMLNPDTRQTVKTIMKDGKSADRKVYQEIRNYVGGWIIYNKKPFLCKNLQRDDRFVKGLFDKVPIKSVVGVPLIIEGIIIGALIVLYRTSSSAVNQEFLKLLENMAAISAPFLRNVQKIRQYFNSSMPNSTLLTKYSQAGLYGKSPRFIELLRAIEAATRCDVRILLVGKTGTGKELIARAIHNFSSRANGPFVAVDCGAIPNTLLESEFFGHTRGAFTGAHTDRQGIFKEADGGTLFMDEINNLPYEMQAKLLRVLEEGELRPVGSNKTVRIDIRIITASSVPLKQLVDDHLFREDLFFRLHVYPIYIPDLSHRKEDIPLIANHFLHEHARQQQKNLQRFHEEVIDFMKQRDWMGNVRELENLVERLVTLTPKEASTIGIDSFPADLREEFDRFRNKQLGRTTPKSLKNEVQNFEAQLIKQALIDCNWNQSETARRLGTTERNIRYKIEKFALRNPEIDSAESS